MKNILIISPYPLCCLGPFRIYPLITPANKAEYKEDYVSWKPHVKKDQIQSVCLHAQLKNILEEKKYDLDNKNVLEYLIFKDRNESGRSYIHHHAFPNVRNTSTRDCPNPVKCSLRHTANSMRVGRILKLRKTFEKGPFDITTMVGDPTKSFLKKSPNHVET